MGETIPKDTNHVSLDAKLKDDWGVPLLNVSVDYDNNDEKMKKDFIEQLTEMLTSAGFKNIRRVNRPPRTGIRYPRNGRRPHGK